jgi:hypothetical protein
MKKPLIIVTVPAPDETFAGAMNISKEREAVLDELMDRYHAETDTYPDALAGISPELDNANELAYVAFHLGAFAESQRTKQDLLRKLLGE